MEETCIRLQVSLAFIDKAYIRICSHIKTVITCRWQEFVGLLVFSCTYGGIPPGRVEPVSIGVAAFNDAAALPGLRVPDRPLCTPSLLVLI